MFKWNPFTKSYQVKCPDGAIRTVFKNANDAFPLSVKDFDSNFKAQIENDILKNGEVSGAIRSKVSALLYGLNEINDGMMLSFRAAYVGYQSDPCTNNEFFLGQIENINEEQRRLRALKMQIQGYVELAKSDPANTTELTKRYSDLVTRIGAPSLRGEGAADAIAASVNAAKKMSGD